MYENVKNGYREFDLVALNALDNSGKTRNSQPIDFNVFTSFT